MAGVRLENNGSRKVGLVPIVNGPKVLFTRLRSLDFYSTVNKKLTEINTERYDQKIFIVDADILLIYLF